MKVAAPPQPPQVSDSGGDDPGEALIKEAKQRARRRRWSYGGAAVVVAIGAVAAFSILPGSTSPPRGAARPLPTQPTPQPIPLGAPEVQGPDPGSTILTSWSGFGVGFVFVYGDGRVTVNDGGGAWSLTERLLSPRGLDLVHAGKLAAREFLLTGTYQRVDLQGEVWAEPTPRSYEPSKYAICPHIVQNPDAAVGVNPREIMDQLPTAAQDLLRGTEHSYPGIPTSFDDANPPPVECFEVTREQARSLVPIFTDPDVDTGLLDIDSNLGDPSQIGFKSASGTVFWLPCFPILPHGEWVLMGG